MPEIKVKKLSKEDFFRLHNDGRYRWGDDYLFTMYRFHQNGIEEALNNLIELIEAKRQGLMPPDFQELLDNVVYTYEQERSRWLDERDKRLFRDLIRRYGIQVVRRAPLDQILQDMASYDMSAGLPSQGFEVIRASGLKSQLGIWQAVEIRLPEVRDCVVRAAEQASVSDPLGLLSSGGLYLRLCSTAKSSTVSKGSSVTIKAVTIALMGRYLRKDGSIFNPTLATSLGNSIDYTLNSDTDKLFSVTLLREPAKDVYETVWIQPQD